MNKLTIIGNLVADADVKTRTINDAEVKITSFVVAANYGRGEARRTQYVRCTAWRDYGANMAPYLTKGKKVMIEGPASVSAYKSNQDGGPRATLELRVDNLEFLSPKGDSAADPELPPPVDEDYPFED